jgi:hypothetical protein
MNLITNSLQTLSTYYKPLDNLHSSAARRQRDVSKTVVGF